MAVLDQCPQSTWRGSRGKTIPALVPALVAPLVVGTLLASAGPAQATLIYYIYESAGDVIVEAVQ